MKNKTPLVSVIIPTYNRGSSIEKALRSVLSQTYSKLEVLVIDDASEDNTANIVNNINDSRVKYFAHRTNRGAQAARNNGIERAKGEVLAFLDDDDLWVEKKLEKQLIFLEKYDAVCTAAKFSGESFYAGRVRGYPYETVRKIDLRKRRIMWSTSALAARKKCFNKIRFDEEIIKSQDFDVFISLIKENYTIGFINEPLAIFNDDCERERITTAIINMPQEKLRALTRVYEKHKVFFGNWRYNVGKAETYLSFIRRRGRRMQIIKFAIKETNIFAVSFVLIKRVVRRIKHIKFRFIV